MSGKNKTRTHIKTDWDLIKTNPIGLQGDKAKRHISNTRHLKRILVYLSEVDYSCKSQFTRESQIPYAYVNDALLFLEKYKLIKSMVKRQGSRVYFLPYKEEIVKEKINLEIKSYMLNRRMKKEQNGELNIIKRKI